MNLAEKYYSYTNKEEIRKGLANASIPELMQNLKEAGEENGTDIFLSVAREMLVQRILNLDTLYVVVDNSTNSPSIDIHGGLLCFSNKILADGTPAMAKNGHGFSWSVQPIPQTEILEFLAMAFYLHGATNVCLDYRVDFPTLRADEIITLDQAVEKFWNGENLSVNPAFCRSVIQMVQLRNANPANGILDLQGMIRFAQDNMINALCEGCFAVPVAPSSEDDPSVDSVNFRRIRLDNGELAIPVFTDMYSLVTAMGADHDIIVLSGPELARVGYNIVVNPGAFGPFFSADQLQECIKKHGEKEASA